jgi:hypothetical protein
MFSRLSRKTSPDAQEIAFAGLPALGINLSGTRPRPRRGYWRAVPAKRPRPRPDRCRTGAVIEPLNRPRKCLHSVLKQSDQYHPLLQPTICLAYENLRFVEQVSKLCWKCVRCRFASGKGFDSRRLHQYFFQVNHCPHSGLLLFPQRRRNLVHRLWIIRR